LRDEDPKPARTALPPVAVGSGRKRLWQVVRAALTLGLISYLVYAFAPMDLIRRQGMGLAPTVIAGTMIVLATLLLSAARWLIVLRVVEERLSPTGTLELTLVGHFFNQLLPTSFGGDGVRIWGAWSSGLSFQGAAASVVLDRIIGTAALAAFIAIGVPLLSLMTGNATLALLGVGFAVATAGAIMAAIMFRRVKPWWEGSRVWSFFRNLSENAARLVRQPSAAIVAFGLSIMIHAAAIYLTIYFARGLGASVTFYQAFLILPSVLFISSLPITIAGWGVREAGLAGGFALLGLPTDVAVTTSLLIGTVNMTASLPGAILFWLYGSRYQITKDRQSA